VWNLPGGRRPPVWRGVSVAAGAATDSPRPRRPPGSTLSESLDSGHLVELLSPGRSGWTITGGADGRA
jgi:hypothetical protein